MQNTRDPGENDPIFVPGQPVAAMPAHLVGTRAALFHLLRAAPAAAAPPARDIGAPAGCSAARRCAPLREAPAKPAPRLRATSSSRTRSTSVPLLA